MEKAVKVVSDLEIFYNQNKILGEKVLPEKAFGVFFKNPSDEELNLIQCEMSKRKMLDSIHAQFYIFFPEDDKSYKKLYDQNIFDGKNNRSWVLPRVKQEIEIKLFKDLKFFISHIKHKEVLESLGKRVFVPDESSFVFKFPSADGETLDYL